MLFAAGQFGSSGLNQWLAQLMKAVGLNQTFTQEDGEGQVIIFWFITTHDLFHITRSYLMDRSCKIIQLSCNIHFDHVAQAVGVVNVSPHTAQMPLIYMQDHKFYIYKVVM